MCCMKVIDGYKEENLHFKWSPHNSPVAHIAGLVGDAQTLVRFMRAEMELYRIQRKINMPSNF